MPRCPHAFTLVELLVVLTVAGLFLAVMLPAVDAARERSRQRACAGNQARIGEAILAWHQSHDRFPTGVAYGDGEGDCQPYSGRTLWTFTILPWLGRSDLAARIGTKGWGTAPPEGESLDVFREPVSQYRCPSDSHVTVDVAVLGIVGYSQSNYVACFSPHGFPVEPEADAECLVHQQLHGGERTTDNPTVLSTEPFRTLPGRAVFNFEGVRRSLDDVTDGTAHTIMLSEVIAGNDNRDFRGQWWCDHGVLYSHWHTPNWPGPDREGSGARPITPTKRRLPGLEFHPGGWPAILVAARSHHPGGVIATSADGAVRTVRDDIAPEVWTALGSMNGDTWPDDR